MCQSRTVGTRPAVPPPAQLDQAVALQAPVDGVARRDRLDASPGRRHVDRWKRYEKPLPGHRVQIDVKFIAPLPGSRKKHYQFTAIDDCTRIRVLRLYDRLNQTTAIRFVDHLLEKLPFKVEVIQTDHGAEFGSQFHYHVLDRGIGHVYIKPATPG